MTAVNDRSDQAVKPGRTVIARHGYRRLAY